MREHVAEALPERGTVTGLKPMPSDPNYRRISVDGRAVARLRADDVEALGLAIGAPWTARLAMAVRDVVARAAARREAMRLLSRRAYSQREMVDRLARRHERPCAEQVAAELASGGWLNDRAYADDLAAATLARKPAATGYLEERLASRGVAPEVARDAAQRATADRSDLDAALDWLRARRRGSHRRAAASEPRRLAAALSRRGFEDDTIRTALDRLGLLPLEESS
jgi:SOS response regulatory protein OraA/RecX